MTAARRNNAKCKQCSEPIVCTCGTPYQDSTEFSDWMRKLSLPMLSSKHISSQNLDYVWHNYRGNWIILIEEKRFGAKQSFAQKDTHNVVSQIFQFASDNKLEVDTAKGRRTFHYRGFYLIVFSDAGPESSEWIEINGRRQTVDDLKFLLCNGVIKTEEAN